MCIINIEKKIKENAQNETKNNDANKFIMKKNLKQNFFFLRQKLKIKQKQKKINK